MAESAAAGARLSDELTVDELRQAHRARQLRDELEVEPVAGDRRGVRGGAPRRRERPGAGEHRVSDAVGQGNVTAVGELEPGRTGRDRVRAQQRPRELLDVEGNALGAVVDRLGQRRSRRLAEDVGDERGRLRAVERTEDELLEAAATP